MEDIGCGQYNKDLSKMDLASSDRSRSRVSSGLKVALRQLMSEKFDASENWSSLLDTALSLSASLTHSLCVDCSERIELDKLVIELWNMTSVMKGKGNLQSLSYAKLRHISFLIVVFLNESTNDQKSLKKQLVVSFLTAKRFRCKECEFAERVLSILNQTWQRLLCIAIEKKNSSSQPCSLEKEKKDMDRDLLKILCLKAEVKFALGCYSDTLAAIDKAKELLIKFPNEAACLSMLCYNFGVDCYQEKHFEHGVHCLRESFDIGKDSPEISNSTQARTLRLMANCYLEWHCDGWQEAALNAVSLANKAHFHSAGIYLRLHLLLLSEGTLMDIKHTMNDLLCHPDCSMDLCMNALHLLKQNQRPEIIFDLRQNIIKKYEVHPEVGSLLVMLLDVFLNASDVQYAKTFAEECITDHNTGRRLDGATTKQFHVLFWGKAAHHFEQHNYLEALTWYNYSLSLYPSLSLSEPNLGKLQRNLATCYLHLGETSRALSAIEMSEKCEPRNAHTLYMAFKIALLMDDNEKALSVLQNLVDCVPDVSSNENPSVICLVAHLALEQEKTHLAIPALECLISHISDDKRVITALRCLLRLLVTHLENAESIDMSSILVHVRTAYNRLLCVKDKELMSSAEIQEEATWFMKVAWNLALQCKDEPFFLKGFFNLCFQLLSLCASDPGSYDRRQKCLIMSCAACLQLVREKEDTSSAQDLLEEVLQHVEEYRHAEMATQKSLWPQGPTKPSVSTDMFLLMFEFEALTKLHDQRAELVLERAFALPNSDPKLFHTLAALAIDPPASNDRLSMRALKVAVRLYLQMESPDFEKCSVDVRKLIELSMNGNEEESFMYFKESLDMIEKRAKEQYPEIEILWLMTKSWNCGLQFYNCGKYQEAEKWCSMSTGFLKHVPNMKDEYEEQMMALYGEILNCLERCAHVEE